MTEKQVEYRQIGKVTYHRSRRAKNLSIRINGQGEVSVAIPSWASYKRAERFVEQKHDWIVAKLAFIERQKNEKLIWKPGDLIKAGNRSIAFVEGQNSHLEILELEDRFLVELKMPGRGGESDNADDLREAVAQIGLRVGKEYLPGILEDCANESGIRYNKLTVKRMRTRWGSCSAKNNISLNSALVFLDEELIRYVCFHELVHVAHKNHSKSFWDALEVIHPGAKKSRKLLRDQVIIA